MAIAAITTWSTNDVLTATALNTNFSTIRDHYNSNAVELSGNQTVAGVKTFSSAPVCSAGLTVSASGITVTGNSTITGTLTALTGITSSGTAALATVTASAAVTFASSLTMSGGSAVMKRVDDGDSGTADTIDWAGGNCHRSKLTGNCTYTFSNPTAGATYYFEVLQDVTGSRTATWPAAVVWEAGTAPTLTTTASRKDCFVFFYNGTSYLGVTYGLNFVDTA